MPKSPHSTLAFGSTGHNRWELRGHVSSPNSAASSAICVAASWRKTTLRRPCCQYSPNLPSRTLVLDIIPLPKPFVDILRRPPRQRRFQRTALHQHKLRSLLQNAVQVHLRLPLYPSPVAFYRVEMTPNDPIHLLLLIFRQLRQRLDAAAVLIPRVLLPHRLR